MSDKRLPVDYSTYSQFANSEKQKQVVEALVKTGTFRKAAKYLNMPEGTFNAIIRRLKIRAAKQGYSPEHHMVHVAPDPFVLKAFQLTTMQKVSLVVNG